MTYTMKRITALSLAVAGLLWLGYAQMEMLRLGKTVDKLENELRHEQTNVKLLQSFAVDNHERIKDMQRKRNLTVTAYSPRARETDSTPNLTATNSKVRAGIVAVSRDLFDRGWVFGKKVYIKGHGVFTIDDLMAASKREQIDIFMYDTNQALSFGKQKLEVHLIDA